MLRRHIRAVVGCIAIFAAGLLIGIAFGAGGGGHHTRTETVVTVKKTVTLGSGGGSTPP